MGSFSHRIRVDLGFVYHMKSSSKVSRFSFLTDIIMLQGHFFWVEEKNPAENCLFGPSLLFHARKEGYAKCRHLEMSCFTR